MQTSSFPLVPIFGFTSPKIWMVDNLNPSHTSRRGHTAHYRVCSVIVMSFFVVTVKGWLAPRWPTPPPPPHRSPAISRLSPSRPEWVHCAPARCCSAGHWVLHTHLSSHVLGALGAETLQSPPAAHMVIEPMRTHTNIRTHLEVELHEQINVCA